MSDWVNARFADVAAGFSTKVSFFFCMPYDEWLDFSIILKNDSYRGLPFCPDHLSHYNVQVSIP